MVSVKTVKNVLDYRIFFGYYILSLVYLSAPRSTCRKASGGVIF